IAPASGEEDGEIFGSAEDLSLPSVGGEDVPSWALDLDLTADIEAAKAREKAKNEMCKPAASRTSGTGGRSTGHARSQDTKPISMQQRRFSSVEDIELGRAVAEQTGELKGQVLKKIALSLPGRSARQCRDRWFNYLDPNLKTTPWSTQEFRLLYLAQDGGFIAVQQESLGELGQESTKQMEAEIANPGRDTRQDAEQGKARTIKQLRWRNICHGPRWGVQWEPRGTLKHPRLALQPEEGRPSGLDEGGRRDIDPTRNGER
ncbi:unnamed protein product, partial [Ectocarpus sp. 8 AP-2014]